MGNGNLDDTNLSTILIKYKQIKHNRIYSDGVILFLIVTTYFLFKRDYLVLFPQTTSKMWFLFIIFFIYNLILTFYFGLYLKCISDPSYDIKNIPERMSLFNFRGNDYYLNTHNLYGASKGIESRVVLFDALAGTRGTKNLSGRDRNTQPYSITLWSISHFFIYLLGTLLIPKLWWAFLGVGALWEIYEYGRDCHDWLDIVWNSFGIATALLISKKTSKTFQYYLVMSYFIVLTGIVISSHFT